MSCTTPSAQLIQHEWAKHGTCMGTTPDAYFATSSGLYARLRYPDMDALSRRPLTVGQFTAAFAAANPGIPATSVRVTATKGWLDELWLCLDTSYNYTRCKTGTGGLAPNARLKIWRGKR
jgi:ribonuclease T2